MTPDLAALADALDRLRDASTVRIGHNWTEAMAGLDAQRDAHDAVYTALAAVLRAVADNAGTTDLTHPVLADVLAAVEPLLPLIPAPEGTS